MHTEDETPPKPMERNSKRRQPRVSFGDDGYIEGWAYLVPRAFRPALDIVLSERLKTITNADGSRFKKRFQEWTEGDPPMFSFGETDALCSREVIRGNLNRFIAQLTNATPDSLDGKEIVPGKIGFRFFEWIEGNPGHYQEIAWFTCTQSDFVAFLQTGIRSKLVPFETTKIADRVS